MQIAICRAYQFTTRVASALLPWREPEVIRGEGSALRLPGKLSEDGVTHPLIVTGPTLRRLGIIDGLVDELRKKDFQVSVFSDVDNDPTITNVENAYACYRENQCDAIIAFGGGSPMDCAKLCGARVAQPKRSISQMKGVFRVRRALPPLYAVPTTAGTGSEATLAAVVRDERHHKYMVGDLVLIPRAAVLDPTMTYGMPKRVTAASGMDAMTHAVEAYIGHSNTAATRKNAENAVRLVFANLKRAYDDGRDAEARAAMQRAAYDAGLAFTRANVGYVHAVAHAIGGRYGIPHGEACAAALPVVLRAYGKTAYRPLAALWDAAGVSVEAAPTAEGKANALIAAVEALNESLSIPKVFSQIVADDIPLLAAQAAKEGNLFYPAPKVLSEMELKDILKRISAGA
ncbi:MAG: iron-containing alcohol dehydrogenase [Eubacteriales bacterium]|nr:iron-containing alcohol dehydrogenase [Eubacteriales bacterium]